ncbi:hypothetical protein BDA99DRAFT_294501 [Phascolomyces articulosus]|uniref:MPN domain-containing protein n=1 Tax=Phascolomyces articulosus TaxID=60185 RepID=A0AAD5JWX9_9FUNG|nr:hypothetical protein BDA99DRAFT_294501 [Phascolomyces articulosus]
MNYPSTPQSNPSPREMNNPSPRRQESSGSPSTNRKPKAPSASTSSSRKIGEKIQVEEKDKKIKIKPVNDEKAQTQVDQEEKPKRRDTEPWSMQNALRGVAGVGPNIGGGTIPSGIEQNKRHDSYSSQPQYPTTTFYNQSDSFNYIKSPVPSAPPYAPPLPPKPIVDEPEPITTSPPSSNGPPLPPKIKDEPEFENEKSPLDNHIKDQLVPKLPPKIGLDEQEESHSLPASMTEGGMPLRYLYLPDSLQQDFLRIAHVNTSKNIETCGILCGTLKNNILRVTTMIIPRQSGTPDSCTTENEEELFDYQDSHELLTFGWIHTHPSQSCFLSSLDLHTHCSYQIMLPEAVAIVCSPKHDPSYGIFRLTDPPGLPLITNCRAEGAFHPHPDEPIYTDTHNDTGHVRIKDYTYEIVDLRG